MDLFDNSQNLAEKIFAKKSHELFMKSLNSSYMGQLVEKISTPLLESSHDMLVQFNHDEKKPFHFDDFNSKAFYIPDDKIKIICQENQNCNLIYIYKKQTVQ